jgi:uncharacterized protein involved in exopolysaccharide biosynthesis
VVRQASRCESGADVCRRLSGSISYRLPGQRGGDFLVAEELLCHRLLQSAELLKQVSRELDLPTQFAARYGEKRPLDEKRVEDLLRRSVQVQRVPATDFIEIRVYSRFPAECARWANEIAETGARQARGPIRIIDKATPPLRPSRPNKPLNLALGAVVGIVLGTMAGGVGAKLAVGFDGKCPPS